MIGMVSEKTMANNILPGRPPMLEVCGFSCATDGRPLLTDLNFSIVRGEHAAILGPNGVGKTTFLRCVDLIRTDWSGTIRLDGQNVRNYGRCALAKKVAWVQQLSPSFFSVRVRDLVLMSRYPHRSTWDSLSSDDNHVVADALEQTGTTGLAERWVETLSGGERQNVLLAAALAQEPELLLLDEPATFLDYQHQTRMAKLLADINRAGVTILEVTHDLNRASLAGVHSIALADRGVVYDGPVAGMMNRETLQHVFGLELPLVAHPNGGAAMILP